MINNSTSKKAKAKIILESIFVFFIAVTPFLHKLYDYFPDDPSATISILGFTIDNGGFHSVSVYFWFLFLKIIPLCLMIIWFFTSKNWWYHIIIIPIAMYAFQLFEVLFDSDDVVDTENIWWVIPICMVVIPVVYFLRIKLYDRYVHGIDIEAMERELEILKAKQKKNAIETSSATTDTGSTEKEYVVDEEFKVYSLSEELNRKLSTHNIEKQFKVLQNWLNFKF
ncbi:hypothetical protein [Maribacter sp.]|uniref:hypothetical protein n=1 Tax=Maribacter sp. TaxID=1897614 RepID=UPI0025C24581|nr:hypothetical protein [Maribacter sp.]